MFLACLRIDSAHDLIFVLLFENISCRPQSLKWPRKKRLILSVQCPWALQIVVRQLSAWMGYPAQARLVQTQVLGQKMVETGVQTIRGGESLPLDLALQ